LRRKHKTRNECGKKLEKKSKRKRARERERETRIKKAEKCEREKKYANIGTVVTSREVNGKLTEGISTASKNDEGTIRSRVNTKRRDIVVGILS